MKLKILKETKDSFLVEVELTEEEKELLRKKFNVKRITKKLLKKVLLDYLKNE